MTRHTIVIQAGGRSSRMGRDKALVPLAGRPMIAHVVERIAPLADQLLITTNRPDDLAFLNIDMISDAEPGAGALPGLLTALTHASNPLVGIVACDMPFVSRRLLSHMLMLAEEADVVVPQWDDRYQPLHAVYRRDICQAAVEQALAAGKKRMISFFDGLNIAVVSAETVAAYSPKGLTFFNVNTPDELRSAEMRLKDGPIPL